MCKCNSKKGIIIPGVLQFCNLNSFKIKLGLFRIRNSEYEISNKKQPYPDKDEETKLLTRVLIDDRFISNKLDNKGNIFATENI